MNQDSRMREKSVFIWGMSEDMWVFKIYFMVGDGMDVVTYFGGVTVLTFFQAFDEVSASRANVEGSTGTIKEVYYVTSIRCFGILWCESSVKK